MLASVSSPWAVAHHSYAMFDTSHPTQISGAVRNLEWANPHVWLWLTVTDAKGIATIYAFEGDSVVEMMRRRGWTKSSVTPGQEVTVSYFPFNDGKCGGRFTRVTLPDGRSVSGG